MTDLKENAKNFLQLHKENKMFVLPNVWDAGSAIVFEKAGFPAIATTSAGIAYALGFPDGEDISLDDLIGKVREINRRITIPLSVDFERGYSENPAEVKKNALRLLEAGAVGFNLEDGCADGTLSPLDLQLQKIHAMNELKAETGIPFVINARTCAYWLNVAGEQEKLQIALERGNAFTEAGADCVFVPGAIDERTVKELVSGISAPLNIIANDKFHDFAKLCTLGVRRLSIGSVAVRAIYGEAIQIAENLRNGDISMMLGTSFSYAKANAFFAKQALNVATQQKRPELAN